jgi:hypothetical protein
VSLIVGWREPVENAFGIAAAGLVSAAGVVSQVRLKSLEALRDNEKSAPKSPYEVRNGPKRLPKRRYGAQPHVARTSPWLWHGALMSQVRRARTTRGA